jgi:hypothetical protein
MAASLSTLLAAVCMGFTAMVTATICYNKHIILEVFYCSQAAQVYFMIILKLDIILGMGRDYVQ